MKRILACLLPVLVVFLSIPCQASSSSPAFFEKTLKRMSDAELVGLLHEVRVESLYYTPDDFPANLRELTVRPSALSSLIRAWGDGGDKDDLFRFNLIIAVNFISLNLSDADRATAADFFATALDDPSPWVRTEAVWGLGRIGTLDQASPIMALLDDPDVAVVNEAILAIRHLRGERLDEVANQEMTAVDREREKNELKDWWENFDAPSAAGHSFSEGWSGRCPYLAKRENEVEEDIESFGEESSWEAEDEVSEPSSALQGHMENLAIFASKLAGVLNRAPASEFELIGVAAALELEKPDFVLEDGSEILYFPSPAGHTSIIIHGLSPTKKLLLSWQNGGINDDFTDYEALRSEAAFLGAPPVGWLPENLYWNHPWRENALGNLVADAVREAAGADLAIVNAFSIRGNLSAGPVYPGLLPHILPYGNHVTKLILKGSDILASLQRGNDDRWLLRLSGITTENNLVQVEPVFSARFDDGEEILPEEYYTVAMPDYLADGSDGHSWLREAASREDLEISMPEAVERYLQNHVEYRPDPTARNGVKD